MTPPELTHRVYLKLSNTDTQYIDRWCYEHFGEQGYNWDSYYANDSMYNFDQYYIFAKHKDAVLFELKWV